MGETLQIWKKRLAPYADILIFVVTLLAANYFWKFTVRGDEGETMVTWLGMDITAPFEAMARHVTRVVYGAIGLFRDTCRLDSATSYRFESGMGIAIVWSCTGLKQAFIWLCLMLTTRGEWWHKMWFIPFGWQCVYLFNLLRIFAISLLTEFHPEWFELLHGVVFKYLFYAMLFGLWVWFVEGIRGQKRSEEQQDM